MKTRLALTLLTVACAACEAPVTSTFVDGTVDGVSFPNAKAVSAIDTDLLGGTRRTVWLGSGLTCGSLGGSALDRNFGPSAVMLPDGGRAPLLIVVQNGNSYLDTGVGSQRVTGTTTKFTLESTENTTLFGRFTTTFVPLPDGGGVADAGTFSGDFVAPPCAAANAGCEATPVGALVVLALALLRMRRGRQAS